MPDPGGAGAARVTMLLGTGAFASKTLASVALLRHLHASGVDAAPYKAIVVLRGRDRRRSADLGSGLPHHVLAARVDPDPWQCPAVVLQTGPWTGDLYLLGRRHGTVALPCRDVVDLAPLTGRGRDDVVSVVHAAAERMVRRHRYVVVEGAGSPVVLDPAADVANIAVARRLQPAILLVTEFSGGAAAGALIGTYQCLPPDVQALVQGFILANTPGSAAVGRAAALVTQRCGLRALGAIPANDELGLDELYTDPAIDGWAAALRDNVDLTGLLTETAAVAGGDRAR